MVMDWPNRFLKTFHYPKFGQIYILPTKVGIYHIAGTILGIIFALSYANPLGIFFIFLWFCFLLSSAIATHRLLARTKIDDLVSDFRWQEDQPFPINAQFNNEDWEIYFRLQEKADFYLIKGKNTLPAGVHQLLALQLASSAPFGLFRCWTFPAFKQQQLIVAPSAKDYGAKFELRDQKQDFLAQGNSRDRILLKDHDSPGTPIQLDHFSQTNRMHWKRMAQGQLNIGLKPEDDFQENSILPLEKIVLPHLSEKMKQALYMIESQPKQWSAVLIGNGVLLQINPQLAYSMALHLGEQGKVSG
jgi:hypothetical protein